MFSSPSRRRKIDGVAGSVRSSRASTPGVGGRTVTSQIGASTPRRRESKRWNNATGAGGSALRTSKVLHAFGGGAGSDDSTMSDYVRTERRKDKSRSTPLDEGTVLSRDDNHAVTIFSRMPPEAHAVLQEASPYDHVAGHIDPVTGFALIMLRDRCFVWSFLSRGFEPPACFSYDMSSLQSKQKSSATFDLALCEFVPKGADREPGILFVSADGILRYGDSVNNAFNVDDNQNDVSNGVVLGLGTSEHAVRLHRCSSTVYVVATTHARLFGIRLVASGGHLRPIVSVFAQPRGIFGRLFGAASTLTIASSGIVALTSASQRADSPSPDVYAISQQMIQKWTLVEGRSEKLVFEEDIRHELLLGDERLVEGSQSAESLKLMDLAVANNDDLVVLYAFELVDGGASHYGLATLDAKGVAGHVQLNSISAVTYSRMSDSRAYSQPRILLPSGGPVVFIVFTEAIVFRLLQGNGGLEESIELRDVATNRIIGTGFGQDSVTTHQGLARLPVVTQRSGLLLVEVDVEAATQLSKLIQSGEDRAIVDTHRLKTKLERGIFHTDNVQNPVSFDLPLDVRGDLVVASEQLSDDIVRSESPCLTDSVDLATNLVNRLERLHSLAAFLSLNGMTGVLTQNCLRRMCADAQLLSAAIDLWEYLNELLDSPQRLHASGNPLAQAIQASTVDVDLPVGTDVIRHFFRHGLRDLPNVLQKVGSAGQRSSAEGIARQSSVTCEANRVILTCFQAAARYRNETKDLYRLTSDKISIESWTCVASNVKVLSDLASMTASLINERTRQLGSAIDKEIREYYSEIPLESEEVERHVQLMLKGQMCELAGHMLDAFEERLAYLACAGASNTTLERDRIALLATFQAERQKALLSLLAIGRLERAFFLAEQHQDFVTLTELSCSLTSDEQKTHRIRSYLTKYGEPFAAALYNFYVHSGQIQALLSQEEGFYDLLRRFLDSDPSLNRIAWLHDLALEDYREASQRLLVEAGRERQSTDSKRSMLSLAKLSHISQLSETQIATQTEQAAIEVLDDQLDLVNVHNRIRRSYLSPGGDEEETEQEDGVSGTDDKESGLIRAEEAVLATAQIKPASGALFKVLAEQLLSGQVLTSEDLIDLLTLHDANESSHADFALALEVYVRARDVPSARAQSTLATLWRRVILFDDWSVVTRTADTADSVVAARIRSTALYQTLLSAAGNQATSEAVLNVERMTVVPLTESLEARLNAVYAEEGDAEEVAIVRNGLMQEAQDEVNKLGQWIKDVNLTQWYNEVQRMVEEEINQQAAHTTFNDGYDRRSTSQSSAMLL